MKKSIAALLLLVIVGGFAGCTESAGGKSAAVSVGNQSSAARTERTAEEKSVSIIVPESAYNICRKYIEASIQNLFPATPSKEESGYVYKVPSDKKKAVLGSVKKQVLADLNALKEKWAGVESIEPDSGFSHITLLCGKNFKADKALSESAYTYILAYRAFSGMETEGFMLGVSALDSESLEAVSEYTYPEKPVPSPAPESMESTESART